MKFSLKYFANYFYLLDHWHIFMFDSYSLLKNIFFLTNPQNNKKHYASSFRFFLNILLDVCGRHLTKTLLRRH